MASTDHSFAAVHRASRGSHLLQAAKHTAAVPFVSAYGTAKIARSGAADIIGRRQGKRRVRRLGRGIARIITSPIQGALLHGGSHVSKGLAHYARSFKHDGIHLSFDSDTVLNALLQDAESR
jgi:hypothetical protein